jgi:hypothetical protein
MTMMKQIVGYSIVVCVLLLVSAGIGHAQGEDKIKIINITPDSLILNGKKSEIAIEIAYELETKKEGIIYLGFNTDRPEGYSIKKEMVVKKGKGSITLKVKVKPTDWRGQAPFYAYVNLSEHPHPRAWKPMVWETKEIKLIAR